MRLILADENFPEPSVEALREYGWDVLTLLEAELSDRAVPDDEVLKFAIKAKRAVLTFNRKDFIKLYRSVKKHYGIIICTFDFDFPRLTTNVIDAVEHEDDLNNKLIRVNRGNK
ncbi:MAG: DUF5615 family PIN-like protein [Bacteroidota bacterium]